MKLAVAGLYFVAAGAYERKPFFLEEAGVATIPTRPALPRHRRKLPLHATAAAADRQFAVSAKSLSCSKRMRCLRNHMASPIFSSRASLVRVFYYSYTRNRSPKKQNIFILTNRTHFSFGATNICHETAHYCLSASALLPLLLCAGRRSRGMLWIDGGVTPSVPERRGDGTQVLAALRCPIMTYIISFREPLQYCTVSSHQ